MERIGNISLKAPAGNAANLQAALGVLYVVDAGLPGQFGRQTLCLFQRISALQASAYIPENGATDGRDDFSTGLSEMARLIKARVGLEVACIDMGG